MSNLVLGAATGYTWEQIKPFIITLKNTKYDGDIILLVDPSINPDFEKILDEYNVKNYKVQTFRRFWPKGLLEKRFTRKIKYFHWFYPRIIKYLPLQYEVRVDLIGRCLAFFSSIAISRYYYYWKLIRNSQYDNILITDVRDVIFQKDPFDYEYKDGLNVAIESDRFRLIDENINRRWIKILYGEKVLQEIGYNLISCSGTTLGNKQSILFYLRNMIIEQAYKNYLVAGRQNFDQGTHNYILRSEVIKYFNELKIGESPIITMLHLKENDFIINQNGHLINKDGSLINIIHQYDWFPNLNLNVINSLKK